MAKKIIKLISCRMSMRPMDFNSKRMRSPSLSLMTMDTYNSTLESQQKLLY